MSIVINGIEIKATKNIKYLGLKLDPKLNFTEHAKIIAAKASEAVKKLSRILSNVSMARSAKRRLLSSVVQSILLYRAPNWANKISAKGRKEMIKIQRKASLRIASAYATVSAETAAIISDLPPIDLMAMERRRAYLAKFNEIQIEQRNEYRKILLDEWQKRWDAATTGRWTHTLIKTIELWFTRRHGEVSFHLTQALSGHGCFSAYLYKIGKLTSPGCWFCGCLVDDTLHTIFQCTAWQHRRTCLREVLGEDIHPDTIVNAMLRSKENWNAVQKFAAAVITDKENEKRTRQRQTLT